MVTCFVSVRNVIYHVSVHGPASFLEQSWSRVNSSWAHGLFLPLRVRKAHSTSHNRSFLFLSEAYGMQACNSGMHDSMDVEFKSCFKGWAQCYCTAHGHSVAGQQGLFSRCWDSHFCFPRRLLHTWSVWCVLILFRMAAASNASMQGGLWLYNICLFCYKVKE